MGRGKRALAAVAILAAVVAGALFAAAPQADADAGELAGDLPVAGGFALVSWSGGPVEALTEAARSRGCNIRSIHANAPGDGLVVYVPGARIAAANSAFLAAYPLDLPAAPVFVACGEPAPPQIVFLGEVPQERQAEIREEIARLQRFHAERFGVVVSDFTLYVSPDTAAAAAVYRDLTGSEYPVSTGHGGTVTDAPAAGILAFVSGYFVNRTDSGTLKRVIAHEYYHVVQYDILRSFGGVHSAVPISFSPAWLTEGTARYGEDLYRERYLELADARNSWLLATLDDAASFAEIVDSFGIQHYGIASSAIDWLVDYSGDRNAHIAYWRSLASSSDWRVAFGAAFGITVDGFFEAFAEYRSNVLASLPRIHGKVVSLDGRPISGVNVMASAGNQGPSSYAKTDTDGAFELLVTDGSWLIRLGRSVGSDIYFEYTYNPETGYANSCGNLYDVVVEGQDVTGIVLAILPELLERSEKPVCNEGRPGFRMISGVVRGPDGEKLDAGFLGAQFGASYKSREIYLCIDMVEGSSPHGTGCARDTPDRFAIYVAAGSYILRVGIETGIGTGFGFGRGWYSSSVSGGFTAKRSEVTVIDVDEADITGIEIRLPADIADLPGVPNYANW